MGKKNQKQKIAKKGGKFLKMQKKIPKNGKKNP